MKIFDRVIKKVHDANLSTLSKKQLQQLYQNFYTAYTEEFSHFMALGDGISMHADRYLVPEFQKVLKKDFNRIFPLLVTTHHTSFIEEEEQAREKLKRIYQQTGKIPEKLLKEHADRFFFIENNYAVGKYLSAADFLEKIKRDSAGEKKKTAHKKNKKKLYQHYKLTPWHKTLLQVMDEFFGIQDTRKKYVLISNHYQYRFLQEASRRSGIPFNLLRFSIFPEFADVLSGKINIKRLHSRKKMNACVVTTQGYEIFTGKSARAIKEFFNPHGKNKAKLKGITASPGKCTGRVRIILTAENVKQMKKGEILISSMTRPEMVPAMKKAAAIVTDEGGITSHAAIISRELGIPCLIGTKTATISFRNGERVTVNADHGWIQRAI